MVLALNRLPTRHRNDLMRGLELGAQVNYGQQAQAENAPSSLSGLRRFAQDKHAVDLQFIEQLLDLSGAAGHMDWTSVKTLIEPVFQAYRVGHEVVERALLRLLCLGRVADGDLADLFLQTWKSLDEPTCHTLVRTFNADGTSRSPWCSRPTCLPCSNKLSTRKNSSRSREAKTRALRSALHYLARVMTLHAKLDGPVIVVERNILHVTKDIMQSPRFREDPTILETAEVLKGTPAFILKN